MRSLRRPRVVVGPPFVPTRRRVQRRCGVRRVAVGQYFPVVGRCIPDRSDGQCNHPISHKRCWREPQSHCSNGRDSRLENRVMVESDGGYSETVRNRHAIPPQCEHESIHQHKLFIVAEWSAGFATQMVRHWTCHFSAIFLTVL